VNPLDDLFTQEVMNASVPSASIVTAQSMNLLDEEWKSLFSEEDAQTISSERL